MRAFAMIALLFAVAAPMSVGQTPNPDICDPAASEAKLLACANAATPLSAKSALAFANLGTRAYNKGDMQAAAQYYARSMPGQTVVDVYLHANRGDVMLQIGRLDLALWDARTAVRLVREGKDRNGPISIDDKWRALPRLVELLDLCDAKQDRDQAAAMLLALPAKTADDFSDRSAVLAMTGKLKESLDAIDAALRLKPDEPMLKNNKCATLMHMNRDAEALPLCEAAFAQRPGDLTIMTSLADAYAKNRRCDDAQRVVAKVRKQFPSGAYLSTFKCPRP